MRLMVNRTYHSATSTLGELLTAAGARFCYTLEPLPNRPEHPCIPAGTYPLTLEPTNNPRLWTPYDDRFLPHLWEVPGRDGIELHAGNHSTDTEGCVILGFSQQADSVASSRDAVKALVDLLRAAGVDDHRAVVADPVPDGRV
jgi:hypothetical protein